MAFSGLRGSLSLATGLWVCRAANDQNDRRGGLSLRLDRQIPKNRTCQGWGGALFSALPVP